MTCLEAFQKLDDYLDRELSAEEADAVRAHLEKCQHCSEVFEFDAAVVRCLKAKLARIDLPDDLVAQMMSKLDSSA
jgi:anti-sigma factor (TIGR02949 family)